MSAVVRLNAIDAHALWADQYDEEPNALLALEQRIVTALLPAVQNMRILDVACGTGRWLEYMLRRGAATGAGIDHSIEMLRRAAVKDAIQKRIAQGDGSALPVPEGAFDLAICSFAASYAAHLQKWTSELHRVLRNDGHLFITDLHPSAKLRGWKRAFRRGEQRIEISSCDYTTGQIVGFFTDGGFRLERCVEACFGEPERYLFENGGKGDVFEQSCREPAVLACYFRREPL